MTVESCVLLSVRYEEISLLWDSDVIKMSQEMTRSTELCSVVLGNAEKPAANESFEFSFFENLPIEIFLHICSFLEVKDMVMTLSRVCKRFHEILADENIWKCWIARRFCSRYPIIPIESDSFDWRGACFDIEKEWKLWGAMDEKIHYVNVNDVHISSSDAIIFINSGSICVSGSRDRSIVLWKPLLLNETPRQYTYQQAAHDGWIWRFMHVQDLLYSCSWDNTVKSWSVETSSLRHISTFSCSSPALAMTSLDGLIIAGDYGKTVYAFDPRAKPEPQFTYSAHQLAVLTLGSNDTDIISGSEDKTLAVWDSRTRSVKQKIKLSKISYPNCCHVQDGNIYFGDNKGVVHVYSSKNGEIFLVSNFEMGHAKAISVIKYGRGYLITGSQDGTIKVCLPTHPPQVIADVRSNGGSVSALDYYNGILAAGSANCVEFWIPKELMKNI